MTVVAAAHPVTEAVFAALQDTTFQTAIGSRLSADVEEDTARPYVWIEIFDEAEARGLGNGDMPEVDLRVHVFSDLHSVSEANELARQVKALLKDQALTITGYQQCGKVFWDRTVPLRNQEVYGVKVHEVVVMFRVICDQVA